MGEIGKELLKEKIKNKRAWEGKEDLKSEDLFAKKPKCDLTPGEKEKLGERRQRNKEAAEKSRKKKKEEFEKIQNENDQLNQDKCEMAAMIEKLKGDVKVLTSEKSALGQSNDQLKRWIGQRASVLGLDKHRPKISRQQGAKDVHSSLARPPAEQGKSPQPLPQPRGDRSLYSPVANYTPPPSSFVLSQPDDFPRPPSPASSTASCPTPPPPSSLTTLSRRSLSPAPTPHFQAVGIKQSVRLPLQTPWLVDAVPGAVEEQDAKRMKEKEMEKEEEREEVVFTGITHSAPDPRQALTPPLSPRGAIPLAEEDPQQQQQQVLYLPKDTYLIVQGHDGRTYPIGQHVTMTTPQLVLANPAAQQNVTMETPQAEATLQTTAAAAAPVHYKPSAARRLALEARSRSPTVREPASTSTQARDTIAYPVRTEKLQDAASVKQTARNALEAEAIKALHKLKDPASVKQAARDHLEKEALEALLKLGYKIEKPEDAASKKQAANDHGYDTPGAVLTIPMDAPEDATTVTVTTTPYTTRGSDNMTAITTATAL